MRPRDLSVALLCALTPALWLFAAPSHYQRTLEFDHAKFASSVIVNSTLHPIGTTTDEFVVPKFVVRRNYHVPTFTDPTLTACGQLSVNKLDILEQMVMQWKGPFTVAVLLLNNKDEAALNQKLERSTHLKKYLRVHVVWMSDNMDSNNFHAPLNYPVNFLRNVGCEFTPRDSPANTKRTTTSQEGGEGASSSSSSTGTSSSTARYKLIIDIDFFMHPSHSKLVSIVQTEERHWTKKLNQTKLAFVLPAFQSLTHQMPRTKDEVVSALRAAHPNHHWPPLPTTTTGTTTSTTISSTSRNTTDGHHHTNNSVEVNIFSERCAACHGATDYPTWIRGSAHFCGTSHHTPHHHHYHEGGGGGGHQEEASPSSMSGSWCSLWSTSSYVVPYQYLFEPYVVINTAGLPGSGGGDGGVSGFDVRFIGRGLNKAEWEHHLACQGWLFVVLQDAFVVHKQDKLRRTGPSGVKVHDELTNAMWFEQVRKCKGRILPLARHAPSSQPHGNPSYFLHGLYAPPADLHCNDTAHTNPPCLLQDLMAVLAGGGAKLEQ